MRMTKTLTVLLSAFVAGRLFAAEPAKQYMPISEARAQISACIAKAEKMSEVIKQLSPSDQVSFLAEVNVAIAALPGSAESKTATFLNVDRAAVTAASEGNKTAMIAEVFATVPPESLTVVNESFANDLLNINADPSRKVSNEQFTRVAMNIMEKVNARCATAENGAVRSTFAVLMLIRASNNTIPELTEQLIKTLPEVAQNEARTEWVPAAMGTNQTKTYEPLLGGADNSGVMPANDVVIRLAGPQLLESMLGDIVENTPIVNNSNRPELNAVGQREGESSKPQPQADPTKEPDGYQGQLIAS